MPGFRINAQRVFLTYSQCDAEPQLLYEFLTSVRPVSRAIIAQENHEDGNTHLHACVEFHGKLNSSNVRILDFGGVHPNIESKIRSWKACVAYCRKEGDLRVTYHGCTAADAAVVRSDGQSNVDHWGHAEECETLREWFTYALNEGVPFGFAQSIWQATHTAHAKTYFENVEPVGAGQYHPRLRELEWNSQPGVNRCLLVLGPSGSGKTTWALEHAPTPFLLVTHVDDLKFVDPKVHKSIVFDEVRCTGGLDGKGQWPLQEQIKLIQWETEASIKIRYSLARIPARMPKIFTCTDKYCLSGNPQIYRRVTTVNLYETDVENDVFYWLKVNF